MPKGMHTTEEQIRRIINLSESRIEQKVIADELGISVATVGRIQKKYNIPASNRYNGGMISSGIIDNCIEKQDDYREVETNNVNEFGTIVAEKVITLLGANTSFIYTVGTKMPVVKITTNNSTDFIIDLKDLVAFGNEILDVADKVTDMKRNVWNI